MKKHNFTEEEILKIRENLGVCSGYCDSEWEAWKDETLATLWKYKPFLDNCKNIAYCYECDLESNQDYYEEQNKEINIILNDNGVIIFQILEKPQTMYLLYYNDELIAECESIEEITNLLFNNLKVDKSLNICDFTIKFKQYYKMVEVM